MIFYRCFLFFILLFNQKIKKKTSRKPKASSESIPPVFDPRRDWKLGLPLRMRRYLGSFGLLTQFPMKDNNVLVAVMKSCVWVCVGVYVRVRERERERERVCVCVCEWVGGWVSGCEKDSNVAVVVIKPCVR